MPPIHPAQPRRARIPAPVAATAGGALLGLWLLIEPLVRFGRLLDRIGQPVTALLVDAAGVGAALGLAGWLALRVLPGDPRRRTGRALAATAGLLTGLLAFWALRETTPAILGVRSKPLYAAASTIAALLVFAVAGGLAAAAHRPAARVFLFLALIAGPAMGALCIQKSAAGRRTVEIRPGEAAWNPGPIRRIYLITIDALRADHVGAYGYPRATSPVLDRLASEGILYESCYSQGNRSELSFGSLLTGLLPTAHGVSRVVGQARPLSRGVTTLAEAMARGGYVTIGLLSNPYLKRGWGLDQGFQVVDEFSYHYRRLLLFRLLEKAGLMRQPRVDLVTIPRGSEVTDSALRLIEARRDDPLFALIHYMDVHHPYWPPDSLASAFHSEGSSRADPRELFRRITSRRLDEPGPASLPPADVSRLRDLYDGVIAFADGEVGRLLEGLDARGLLEESLVIVTADHGDEFGEHGYLFHANPIPIETLTRVPLILWSPRLFPEPERIGAPVSHIDLFPTLMEIARIEGPATQGLPLPIPGEAARADSTRLLVSEGPGFSSLRRFAAGGFWKLWWDRASGDVRLFDLADDPGEKHDLRERRGALADSLKGEIEAIYGNSRKLAVRDTAVAMDDMTIEELRSLGYVN